MAHTWPLGNNFVTCDDIEINKCFMVLIKNVCSMLLFTSCPILSTAILNKCSAIWRTHYRWFVCRKTTISNRMKKMGTRFTYIQMWIQQNHIIAFGVWCGCFDVEYKPLDGFKRNDRFIGWNIRNNFVTKLSINVRTHFVDDWNGTFQHLFRIGHIE